uniref:Uncharacterized protein n=1 Tax=Lepeophtheirus salmonis TaxID=72036 RepID=A0A0K2UM04_LEPSM
MHLSSTDFACARIVCSIKCSRTVNNDESVACLRHHGISLNEQLRLMIRIVCTSVDYIVQNVPSREIVSLCHSQ